MPRDLSAGMITALASNVLRPVFFVEIVTASGTVRLWSGISSITWNSQTWSGVGKFGSISDVGETTEVRAEGIKLTLSGIPSDMITLALTSAVPGKNAKVWLALIVESGSPPIEEILEDPFLSYSGKTDAVRLTDGGESATIEISVENKLIGLHRAKQRRYTHEDQQDEFAGDKGFEFVEKIQDLNLTVGRSGAPPFGSGIIYEPPQQTFE